MCTLPSAESRQDISLELEDDYLRDQCCCNGKYNCYMELFLPYDSFDPFVIPKHREKYWGRCRWKKYSKCSGRKNEYLNQQQNKQTFSIKSVHLTQIP